MAAWFIVLCSAWPGETDQVLLFTIHTLFILYSLYALFIMDLISMITGASTLLVLILLVTGDLYIYIVIYCNGTGLLERSFPLPHARCAVYTHVQSCTVVVG